MDRNGCEIVGRFGVQESLIGGVAMKNFATRAALTAFAVIAVACTAGSLPAFAQSEQPHKTSLSLPLPKPVPAPSPMPEATPPQETTHARSAHHTLKIEQPIRSETTVEAGDSPLQGAGPPAGNPPAVAAQGSGPLLLSPLQGAGPMDARAMLLGSAGSFGTK